MQWGPLVLSHEVSWALQKMCGEKLHHGGTADTTGLPSVRCKADLSSTHRADPPSTHSRQTLLQYIQDKPTFNTHRDLPSTHTEQTLLKHTQSRPPSTHTEQTPLQHTQGKPTFCTYRGRLDFCEHKEAYLLPHREG